ncbi:MAG: FAD-dependent oxidoreductase [Bacteroidetes bacterium]|nr:FAD-dependent oxidoreductase [Bacteroidota bacterium]
MDTVLTKIQKESEHVMRFYFEATDRNVLQFVPGQFVIFTIPGLAEFQNTRSYSIASAPGKHAQFELCISLNPNGIATPILWKLKPGDHFEMSEPQGNFIMQNAPELETVFICTGTGIAPFRSMLGHLLENGNPSKPVHLIFGNRFENDILYREEFEKLAKEFSNFHFHPVLSRDANWIGTKGYVHQVYQQLFADGRDARFYICGWKDMCSDARRNLKEMGYNRQQYFFELYD